jgi:hypothetical protein
MDAEEGEGRVGDPEGGGLDVGVAGMDAPELVVDGGSEGE